MPVIETCLSPMLFPARLLRKNFVVVVIDVLRATTAFAAALDRGFGAIIPVFNVDVALQYKRSGYAVAAERDGDKLDFADFGNSPTGFLSSQHVADQLVYTTTNGTRAIKAAQAADELIAASFSNLSAAASWIEKTGKDTVILCAGWKDTYSLEDTLCAGALAVRLLPSGQFTTADDATLSAIQLWKSACDDLKGFVRNSSHYRRLVTKNLHDDLDYCFRIDTSLTVPQLVDGKLIKSTI